MNEDFEIDPIWENDKPKKKKKQSGPKGKRGERGLTKILTERFGKPFSRVPQSGNRMAQVVLPEHVKEAYVGDIVTPPGFRYCVEVKHGYPEINFNLIVGKNAGLKLIDGFLEQAVKDAKRVNREPLLCWKEDFMPWICFTRNGAIRDLHFFLRYGPWVAVSLDQFLTLPDAWFFHETP